MINPNQSYLLRSARCCLLYRQIRWRSKKEHWADALRKKKNTDRALDHFDDFYKQVFTSKWPSVRLGLLTQNKYCAVINNYSDTERIEQELQSLGAVNMKQMLKAQSSLKESKMWKRRVKDAIKEDFNENSKVKNLPQESPQNFSPNISVPTESSLRMESERLIMPDEMGGPNGASAIYDFVPATRLKGMDDFIPESQHYSYYKPQDDSSQMTPQVESEERLIFPHSLAVYTFEPGNTARFPRPGKGSTGVTDYYLMDGGSILPVLCLGLQPGDSLLDMCSAPGGKTLLALQTLLPKKLVSNDSSLSRLNRLKRVLDEFFYDLPKKEQTEQLVISNCDARELSHLGQFNKILVDVPCTTDRFSLQENDNNIFRPDRIKDRIKLPEIQTEILTAALKQVEDGGTVVYSTCSLSPIQNDGVVQMALKRIWEETSDNIIVKDMTRALEPYKVLYRFGNDIGLRYGHLVVPYLPSNYGPMYFCKLVKRNKY